MGQVDLEHLFEIYYEINKIKKTHKLDVSFKIDEGTYETALEFIGMEHHHPPISEDWSSNPTIFCPDLMDYTHKIIIEYEEEGGQKRSGARLAKKGHGRSGDEDNERDSRRNRYYEQGGFRLHQIWDSDHDWKKKLEEFMTSIDIKNY